MSKFNANAVIINRILLGLLFLVAGLTKLFVFKPSGVTGMLSGLGFPAAMFFAWVLIIVEVLGGISLLFNFKTKYSTSVLIVVMVVATFTTYLGNWTQMVFHLAAASNLLVILSNNK